MQFGFGAPVSGALSGPRDLARITAEGEAIGYDYCTLSDHVVIPRGTEAHIRMVEDKKGGHLHGKAKVRLELVSLIINGERLGVDTNAPSKEKGSGSAKASAEAKKGSQGAGAMAGNPGAAAGPVIAAFSAAKVDVKPGSRIQFALESPFTFEPPPLNALARQ